ncbi:MAG: Holliday junction branch migration protein RuvA [Ardenticatenaceae bacterium]
MIATLRGKVLFKVKDTVMLDVRGVGHRVRVPTPFLAEAQVGHELFCYTHLSIREKEWNLFGFKTLAEMEFFQLLLTVQRLGPRVALAALSKMKPDVLADLITSKRADLLINIPGVGKKMAKRMILDLKEKVADYGTGMVPTADRDHADAISALMALAYTKAEARKALKGVPSHLKLDEKIYLALQRLDR